MSEFIGLKGARLDYTVLSLMVGRQVKAIQGLTPDSQPKPDPLHIQGALEMYNIILKGPKYDRAKVLEILRNLPYSIGGIYVVPNGEMVVELGIGSTHADYSDMVEDDPVSQIMVARPKSIKDSGAWRDVMLVMKDIAKVKKTNDTDLIWDIIDSEFDVVPGGMVTCIGWGKHSCGNVLYRKELYHGYRCPECTRAFKAARGKKGGGASTAALIKSTILRKKIRL